MDRSIADIAKEIAGLEQAHQAGQLSIVPYEAAKRALLTEMRAASAVVKQASTETETPTKPGTESPPKSREVDAAPAPTREIMEAGFFRVCCSSCANPGVWLVCMKCHQSSSFQRTTAGQVRCSCDALYQFATCLCGARVDATDLQWTPQSEGPVNLATPNVVTRAVRNLARGLGGISQESLGGGVVIAMVFAVCCGCLGLFGGGGTPTAARQAVLSRLKAPSTAQFAETVSYGHGRYYVAVDAQNGFGAQIRNGFCVVLPGGDPNAPDEEQVFECSKGSAAILFSK